MGGVVELLVNFKIGPPIRFQDLNPALLTASLSQVVESPCSISKARREWHNDSLSHEIKTKGIS